MTVRRIGTARCRFALAFAAALTGAIGLVPHRDLLSHLGAPHHWVTAVGADRAAGQCAGGLLWLVSCWVTLALTAGLLSRLPGSIGRGSRRFALAALPRCLRPILVAATGAGILIGPAMTMTGVGASADGAPAARAAHTSIAPAPAWPTDDPVPTPAWPTGTTAPAPRSSPRATPAPTPQAPKTTPPRTATHPPAPAQITVHPGDSLWSIAEREQTGVSGTPSAARVARAWPAWFAANRAVIGDDPDLIRPGQHLRAPGTSTSRSTTSRSSQGGQP